MCNYDIDDFLNNSDDELDEHQMLNDMIGDVDELIFPDDEQYYISER